MKQGLSLPDLATEIKRQSEMKKDFLADTRRMEFIHFDEDGMKFWMATRTNSMRPKSFNTHTLHINETAHMQIGQKLGIPTKYYDRLLTDHPDMLAYNVNTLFGREPSTQMVRTLDGTVRAFLSERYRILDNDQIAEAVLPIILEWMDDGARVESAEITDKRLYLKIVNPKIEAEIVPGDIVQSGIVISNSEVGHGSVSVSPMVYRLICKNGMIRNDAGLRKVHVGRINNANIDNILYRDETIEADDKAFLMKLQDVVRSTAESVHFESIVDQMRDASKQLITGNVYEVVQLVNKNVGITEAEGVSVLDHLIRDGNMSKYSLSSAITRAAHDVSSYDRSTEMEQIGYEVVSMSPTLWKQLNAAAS